MLLMLAEANFKIDTVPFVCSPARDSVNITLCSRQNGIGNLANNDLN